jgi:hypothetical protein
MLVSLFDVNELSCDEILTWIISVNALANSASAPALTATTAPWMARWANSSLELTSATRLSTSTLEALVPRVAVKSDQSV